MKSGWSLVTKDTEKWEENKNRVDLNNTQLKIIERKTRRENLTILGFEGGEVNKHDLNNKHSSIQLNMRRKVTQNKTVNKSMHQNIPGLKKYTMIIN